VFPRPGGVPLSIDLSLSEVARGKLMVAAKAGQAIPLGWALDAEGHPTTDPQAGLAGSMLPMGGNKGAMLALVVELLVTALTGAAIGFEATSFFVDEGNRPRLGQAFLVIDPDALGGRAVCAARIETLVAAMLADPGVRLPGHRRAALAEEAARSGVAIPDALAVELARRAA
jgi:(2R)-3-sulfolactate dehydrogenase (NADP+)